MKLGSVTHIALYWLTLPALGQATGPTAVNPVHWSAEPATMPDPRGRFQVPVHAAVDAGWHLYALPEADGFPLATEIAIDAGGPAELLRVQQSPPRHSLDTASNIRTAWFEHDATFTLQLRRNRQKESARTIAVEIRYQACNDRLCLPARTEMLSVTLPR